MRAKFRSSCDKVRTALLCVAAAAVSGCARLPPDTHTGALPYPGQPDAKTLEQIAVTAELPPGAELLGTVTAARCHRRTTKVEPTNDTVTMDLRAAAFAKGATGIAAPAFDKSVDLGHNCWYTIKGSAQAFRQRADIGTQP